MKLTPVIKGVITAVTMILTSLGLFYTNQPGNSVLQYLPYAIYATGIVWTLISYRQSPAYTGKFKDLFGQGFRCFIVVTLIMVVFTAIFLQSQPGFKEEGAKAYREFLIKEKNTLPDQIEKEVDQYRRQFNMRFISASIFGYLIIGAVVTAGCSAVLTRRPQ